MITVTVRAGEKAMGTRADFYLGRGETAEWLGSVAWDGYPDGIVPHGEEFERIVSSLPPSCKTIEWPAGQHLFDSTTEAEFRERLERFFLYRDDVSRPADGWPWPWDNSGTTDYAYAFDAGAVWATAYDGTWFEAAGDEPDEEAEEESPIKRKRCIWPDMSKYKATTFGPRSGLIVFGG